MSERDEAIARAMAQAIGHGMTEKCLDRVPVFLAALDAAGKVVVSKEPTVEMLTAGTEEWLTVRAMEDRAAVIWRAMLAAAKEGER